MGETAGIWETPPSLDARQLFWLNVAGAPSPRMRPGPLCCGTGAPGSSLSQNWLLAEIVGECLGVCSRSRTILTANLTATGLDKRFSQVWTCADAFFTTFDVGNTVQIPSGTLTVFELYESLPPALDSTAEADQCGFRTKLRL